MGASHVFFGPQEWYRQARGLNRQAVPFLIGTKYDIFVTMSQDEQAEIDKLDGAIGSIPKAPAGWATG